jgi:hypothetical protein
MPKLSTTIEPQLIIYGLIDPRTRLVRYIGKSSIGMKRPRQHGQPCFAGGLYVHRWIAKLRSIGLMFEIVVLDVVDDKSKLSALERWWIAYGRTSGWPLTNVTDGGEGAFGRKLSQQTRDKIAAKARGRKVSAETRAKLVKWGKIFGERNCTEEARARMRGDNNVAKTPEAREKIRIAALKENRSPEWRAKISESNRRRAYSAATRAKIGTASRGRGGTRSEESRARQGTRMREAIAKRRAQGLPWPTWNTKVGT